MDALGQMLGEHEGIRHYADVANEDVAVIENILRLGLTSWSPEQRQTITDRHFSLRQGMANLKDALHDHYNREEQLLRPFLGDFLMKALSEEARSILKRFATVIPSLAEVDVKESSWQELLAQSTRAKDVIGELRESIDAHSHKMDSVLQLLKAVS